MSIGFSGVTPPRLDLPIIELEIVGGPILDLYNECHLASVCLEGSVLAFAFLTPAGPEIRVLFRDVRGLRVEQPPDWAPAEGDQIEHLLIRREGPWRQVEFLAGGLTYEFDAAELAVVRD